MDYPRTDKTGRGDQYEMLNHGIPWHVGTGRCDTMGQGEHTEAVRRRHEKNEGAYCATTR